MTLAKQIFTDKNNRSYTVRIVPQGGKYGRNFCLTHDKAEPMIEFYDVRYAHDHDVDGTVLGQFVSRYYLTTLLGAAIGNRGIQLNGGIPEWNIAANAITAIAQWANDNVKTYA